MNQIIFDPENMLKGRIAESLVEELLKKSGNKVYRFGYEAILQNLTQIDRSFDRNSAAGERLQAIPDFIVLDINGNPVFLEVKYRGNGRLRPEDKERLGRIKEFWSAKMIFVNCTKRPFFRVSNPPSYMNADGSLQWSPLIEERAWKIDAGIYEEFEGLVEKYLGPTLLSAKAG